MRTFIGFCSAFLLWTDVANIFCCHAESDVGSNIKVALDFILSTECHIVYDRIHEFALVDTREEATNK